MKDPRRLLDGDGSDAERELLRAGMLEEPAPGGGARLLAALGVTAPSTLEAPTNALGTGHVAAGGGATAGATAATKLVVLALGSAVLVGAGAMLWARTEQPERPTVEDAPKSAPESAARPRDDRATHNPESTGSVALEIEALERVRSELGRKDGQAALGALRRYASAHPHGVLAHEADVLRVEALLLEGESAAALELAEHLLRGHGDSPHRARIEALARQAGAPSEP